MVLNATAAARAEDSAAVDTAVNGIVEVIKSAGEAVKAGLGIAEQGLDAAKDAYQTVAPAVQTATDAVAPAVKGAVQAAAPVVQAGVRAATDAASSVKPGLERVLSDSGVDVKAVAGAEQAVEKTVASTKPLLESLVQFLTTSSPTTLAETAVGLAAAYYLLPPLLKLGFGALRGYGGDVSPAAALDALSTRGDTVMVDIRTAREKEATGIPDLPNSGKLVELEFAAIEDRKIRGQLRNLGALETKITAMQVAALKRLSKGSTVYLLDRNGSVAKAVAKELASRGFGKVFVVNGGFGGWARDRLGVKPASTVSRVEVLLPGSIRMPGTASSRVTAGTTREVRQLPQQARRALPPGR